MTCGWGYNGVTRMWELTVGGVMHACVYEYGRDAFGGLAWPGGSGDHRSVHIDDRRTHHEAIAAADRLLGRA